MERLTIKELAPYLPYALNFVSSMDKPLDEYGKQPIWTFNGISEMFGDYCLLTKQNNDAYGMVTCKPLLRPISSIDLKWFQDNIDEALEDFRINCEPENNHFSVEVCEKVLGWSALSLEEYQLFYRDHVDIHGLIDHGLALPIDGKEVEGDTK